LRVEQERVARSRRHRHGVAGEGGEFSEQGLEAVDRQAVSRALCCGLLASGRGRRQSRTIRVDEPATRPTAEPPIWTARMLATLDKGVIGGKWYSLIDKLYPETTLRAAYKAVAVNRGAAGVDHVSIEDYAENLDANLARLSETLRTGSYRPQAIRRHYIPKQGSQEKRPLGIPTVQDRVVQTALRMVIEPIFEREFAQQSYGFRPNLGCKDALRRVDELLKAG
jgi:hypothetical protein